MEQERALAEQKKKEERALAERRKKEREERHLYFTVKVIFLKKFYFPIEKKLVLLLIFKLNLFNI